MAANNLTTLNGLFKEVYANKLECLIPDNVMVLKKVPFIKKDQQNGSFYHQPVVLGLEHGVSYAISGDAFPLNGSTPGQIKDAQVQGAQHVLQSSLSYTAASRALSGGATAFESATKFLVGNMFRSLSRKLEMDMFYGQDNIGTVASIASTVVTITTAEWAPGIWAGAEGMPIEIRNASGSVSRGTASVVAVDLDLRTITLSSAPAGVVATDAIHVSGAYGKQLAGLRKIISNTGVLFNIDASQYNLWKGNIYDAGGAQLSFAKITSAIARAVEKGLDSKVNVLVNPRTWSNLLSDQAALRMYDQSYSSDKMENGSKSIRFHGQNGEVEVTPSTFVKEGLAFILAEEELVRVGSTDITFKRPGQGDEFFRDLETTAAYELRAFSDQALFCSAPGKLVLITNIVNA